MFFCKVILACLIATFGLTLVIYCLAVVAEIREERRRVEGCVISDETKHSVS